MSKPDGYLFDIPEPLLKGGMFIPLGNQVVLPGGAAMIRSTEHSSAKIFEDLGIKNEFFTAVLAKDDAPDGEPGYHEIGTLSLIADHKVQRDGTWLTIIAGIGRVGDKALGGDARVADLVADRIQAPLVARGQHHVEALVGETAGDGSADAPAWSDAEHDADGLVSGGHDGSPPIGPASDDGTGRAGGKRQ